MLDLHSTLSSGDARAPRAAPDRPDLHVLLAAPRGFCAGVRRAIAAVEGALARHGPPVYVRRPIVHNDAVVRALEAKGARFVAELDAVPDGAVVLLSAHGVAPAVHAEARRRGLRVYDAVCPLVAKVHRAALRHHRAGRHLLLIGHDGHAETEGTLGHLPPGAARLVERPEDVAAIDLPADAPVAYAVQTTFSVEDAEATVAALEARFADLAAPSGSDICYATTNRQAAVRAIAARSDAIIVAGADYSSNARRLAEVAAAAGCGAVQLVADADAVDHRALAGAGTVGLTAAASTPDEIVEGILAALRARYRLTTEEVRTAEESVEFRPVAIGPRAA
jgi:4-hydroxy-3-methylbut-2-en-1-yl diphosphate reductase